MSKYDKTNDKLVRAWLATDSISIKREIETLLVEANKGFIYRALANKGYDLDTVNDLYNESAKSVIRALEMFDITMGYKFISFWSYYIKHAISQYFYWRAKYSEEIPDCTIKGRNNAQDDNYGVLDDQPIHDKDYEHGVEAILSNDAIDDRERGILQNLYGHELNMAQVASLLSVTPSRVQQLVSKALKKLHHAYKSDGQYVRCATEWKMQRTGYISSKRKDKV